MGKAMLIFNYFILKYFHINFKTQNYKLLNFVHGLGYLMYLTLEKLLR